MANILIVTNDFILRNQHTIFFKNNICRDRRDISTYIDIFSRLRKRLATVKLLFTNKLSIQKKTRRNLKCVLLSERSQSKKVATYYVIPLL